METNLAQGVNSVEVEKLRVGQQAGGNLGIKWWRPSRRGKEEQWLVGSEAQRLGILLQSLVRGDSGLLRTSPEGRTAEAPGPAPSRYSANARPTGLHPKYSLGA